LKYLCALYFEIAEVQQNMKGHCHALFSVPYKKHTPATKETLVVQRTNQPGN